MVGYKIVTRNEIVLKQVNELENRCVANLISKTLEKGGLQD